MKVSQSGLDILKKKEKKPPAFIDVNYKSFIRGKKKGERTRQDNTINFHFKSSGTEYHFLDYKDTWSLF